MSDFEQPEYFVAGSEFGAPRLCGTKEIERAVSDSFRLKAVLRTLRGAATRNESSEHRVYAKR